MLLTSVVNAECYVQASTVGTSAGALEQIADVQNWPVGYTNGKKKCIVTFRGFAKNKWYNGTGEYIYDNTVSEAQACSMALDVGKRSLVEQVFHIVIRSESQTVCSDFPQPELRAKTKVGDVVKLSEVQPMPGTKPFGYKNAECRWFVESEMVAELHDLYVYKGIICNNVKTGIWTVMDRF